jgi:hypothetical protein
VRQDNAAANSTELEQAGGAKPYKINAKTKPIVNN